MTNDKQASTSFTVKSEIQLNPFAYDYKIENHWSFVKLQELEHQVSSSRSTVVLSVVRKDVHLNVLCLQNAL